MAEKESESSKLAKSNFAKLDRVQQMYVKRTEKLNVERATGHVIMRNKLRFTGLSIAGVVLATYLYTISAVKQEKLGEEFDQRFPTPSSQKQVPSG